MNFYCIVQARVAGRGSGGFWVESES